MNNTLEKHLLLELKETFTSSKIGFEKESLRISNSSISQKSHPSKLGSALCNNYITTDFSESQLELVTPPFEEKMMGISFLEDIHHFVFNSLDDEILWPLSMPPLISSDQDIKIANYGSSNLGLFKATYRKGLSARYGRMMQTISGLHYNYSLSESIWESRFFDNDDIGTNHTRSKKYFNMLRNIYRLNWIVIYLFGASPIVPKSFLAKSREPFIELDNEYLYLPNATSLRMSSFGYQNKKRKLQISLNSIDEYISDLRTATETASSEFQKIKNKENNQINDSILQIDDEYYAIARAKSQSKYGLRTTSKLEKGGVDFIELRSLDLDPFSSIGIDEKTVYFLEVFFIYCFIKEGHDIDSNEMKNIDFNDEIVATKGRSPQLKIINDSEKIKLRDWGNKILDDLLQIAEILDKENSNYTKAVSLAKYRMNNPNETLSAQVLDGVFNSNKSFLEFGMDLATRNKDYYSNRKQSDTYGKYFFETEAKRSLVEQKKLEINDTRSFKSFLNDYFRN